MGANGLDQSPWRRAFSYHPMDVEISHAKGVFIHDVNGRRYFDVTGGPFTVNVGHSHPALNAAITEQLHKYAYAHPMLANRKRIELCEAIASIAPAGLTTSYLVSGGSEAVETALKIARQYHTAQGKTGKYKIISNYDSYHGMTLATMGLSGNPNTLRFHSPMIPRWPKVPQYSDFEKPLDVSRDDWAVKVAAQFEHAIGFEGAGTVAAYILTPHGSGADYGVVAPDIYWREIRRICDENDVLLIADEVVTGFGRTGKWFGMSNFSVVPDIMTCAKGISSGYIPLGAVTVSERVNEPFQNGERFIHGFTNGGNPVACAAGLAVIELLRAGLLEEVAERGSQLFSYADRLRSHPSVADVRGWGMFMALELVQPGGKGRSFFPPEMDAEQAFQKTALSNGLVFYSTLYGARRQTGPSRGLPMWITPPFTITSDEMDDMMDGIDRALTQWESSMAGRYGTSPGNDVWVLD